MSKFKKCKVIMLPTKDNLEYPFIAMNREKGSNNKILLVSGNSSNSLNYEPQHLYITSKEQIKEGDWYYNSFNHTVSQADKRYGEIKNPLPHRKIVATTDKSLLKDFRGYEYGTAREYSAKVYLPQIPQSFIKQYVEAGGIDEIDMFNEYIETDSGNYIVIKPMLELPNPAYDWFASKSYSEQHSLSDKYFESRNPSLLTNEQVTEMYKLELKGKEEKLYTREEVEALLYKHTEDMFNQRISLEDWIEQNL